jgi:hypothetical protein
MLLIATDAIDQNDIHVKMTQFDAFPDRLFTSNRITCGAFENRIEAGTIPDLLCRFGTNHAQMRSYISGDLTKNAYMN